MRMLAVGGGSGGHVAPVVSVINELAKQDADVSVTFVCDKGFYEQSKGLMDTQAVVPVTTRVVAAGRFRRYVHLPWWRQLLMPSIVGANIADLSKIGIGVIQSLRIIAKDKPDIMFAKGGFVCLPVGVAARIRRIPIVIHDSDTRAGLTNRLLSRWATKIATGAPVENYGYDAAKTVHTGVPVRADFVPFSAQQQREAKEKLGFSEEQPLVVVTGGGLGSRLINTAVVAIASKLSSAGVGMYIIAGRDQYDAVQASLTPDMPTIKAVPFVYDDMPSVLGAADVVVARASATFIQELAGLKKPVIIVPARQLGDQQKNAKVYEKANAAIVLSDDQLESSPAVLYDAISSLLSDTGRAERIATNLHAFAKPDAAHDLATMIDSVYKRD